MWLVILKSLVTNAGLIMSVVQLVEKMFPDSPGKEKLEHALNLIGGLLGAAPEVAADVDKLKAGAAPLVNLAVAVANASGVFAKPLAVPPALSSSTSASAPAAAAAPVVQPWDRPAL